MLGYSAGGGVGCWWTGFVTGVVSGCFWLDLIAVDVLVGSWFFLDLGGWV